jgi:hypothetical protein
MCSGSRRRRGCVGEGAGKLAGGVAARAAAARRGMARAGQREAGKAAARVLGRHVARGKAAWGRPVRGTWPARAVGRRAEKTESRGLEVDEGDLFAIS